MLNPIMKIIGDHHGQRPYRRPMGVYRAPASQIAQAIRRSGSPLARFPKGVERHTVDIAHRCAMVGDAESLSSVSDLSSSIPAMAEGRCDGPPP